LWGAKLCPFPFAQWNYLGNIVGNIVEVDVDVFASTLLNSDSKKGTFEIESWTGIEIL
jgi:hypothetical protein